MKKTFLAISFVLIATSAGAQTMYDALNFSQNNYYGTARSIAMGNAMTAVGGDLGSVGINPAGSAVYNYSQFTITPNLTVSSSSASFSPYAVNGTDTYGNAQTRNLTRFSMPNIGATFNMQTGRRSGLKSVTYGFIVNGTSNYTSQMMAGGENDKTSYLSSMAVDADGYNSNYLLGLNYGTDYPYDYADDEGYYPAWNLITAAQAGGIGNYGETSDKSYLTRYVAATETFTPTGVVIDGNHQYGIELSGPLNQSYGRKTTGSKYDALFNFGLNFNDRIFVGGNLGFTSITYDYDEYFKEAAVNTSDFAIDFQDGGSTAFSDFRARYSYSAEATGIYGKVGIIGLPADGLRLGAAIQTPTLMHISEVWRNAADVNYTTGNYSGSATSPEGSWAYLLRTPYIVNAGAAYTFMGMAMISVDYEMTDYSFMKFRDSEGYSDTFEDVNDEIRDCMGISHALRIGAEVKPVPAFAIRAGYNFTTIPEYSYDGSAKTKLNDRMNSFSIGCGYSSNGSFFADLAARATMLADEYISPYADYLSAYTSPLILNKRERYDITLTLGWRF